MNDESASGFEVMDTSRLQINNLLGISYLLATVVSQLVHWERKDKIIELTIQLWWTETYPITKKEPVVSVPQLTDLIQGKRYVCLCTVGPKVWYYKIYLLG